jgi:hypothetical protein
MAWVVSAPAGKHLAIAAIRYHATLDVPPILA